METFYVILYCSIRPVIDERISIALLLKVGNKIIFKYSPEKLKIAKILLPDAAFDLLWTSLKNIERFIKDGNEDVDSQAVLWDYKKEYFLSTQFFRKDYISYLNRYANNLLQFSEPQDIQVHAIAEAFDSLYKKFIFVSKGKINSKRGVEPEGIIKKERRISDREITIGRG
jgi:hypothetical protein